MTVNRADLLTPEIVQGLWTHMGREFGFEVITKATSEEMQLAGRALEAMGIQSAETFLNEYTTTIGRKIYIPFEIGVSREDGRYSLLSQVLVCGHEATHVCQFLRPTGGQFVVEYLLDPSRRASYEVEAMRTDMEVYRWLYDGERALDPRRKAETLYHYGCPSVDVDVAEKALNMVAVSIGLGAVATRSGKQVIRYLSRELQV